jgi:hypothetical protein
VKLTRKEFFQNAVRELTTVSSLLSGFTFTGTAIIVTNTSSVHFSLITTILCALTTILLAATAIVGALFSLYHLAKHEDLPALFMFWPGFVLVGIALFFLTVTSLMWSLQPLLGIISAGGSALAIGLIIWAWIEVVSTTVELEN